MTLFCDALHPLQWGELPKGAFTHMTFPAIPREQALLLPHLKDEETEAQKGELTTHGLDWAWHPCSLRAHFHVSPHPQAAATV